MASRRGEAILDRGPTRRQRKFRPGQENSAPAEQQNMGLPGPEAEADNSCASNTGQVYASSTASRAAGAGPYAWTDCPAATHGALVIEVIHGLMGWQVEPYIDVRRGLMRLPAPAGLRETVIGKRIDSVSSCMARCPVVPAYVLHNQKPDLQAGPSSADFTLNLGSLVLPCRLLHPDGVR